MDISNYAPIGSKDCESNCDREVIVTKDKTFIVCNYCERIVRVLPK